MTGSAHLAHVSEHVIASPAGELPVIVVLPGAADAEGTVDAGRSAQELAAAQIDLAVVDAASRLGDDVPVGLAAKVLRPAAQQEKGKSGTQTHPQS